MCLGFTQNFAGFVVVRAFLGIAEGGLLPGMVRPLSPDAPVLAHCAPDSLSIRHVHASRFGFEDRIVLHGGFALWGLWRPARAWPGRNWDTWRLVILAVDFRNRRLVGESTSLIELRN